jgi:prepilin-type N-terminal cleavage/methylation domain-containing protein
MLTLRFLRSVARDDGGFSLIELVVAMLISGVIIVVLLTVLTFTTRQTSLVTEKVQATRTGRQTMTKVLDELHSACLGSGYAGYFPVQEKSTASKLIFYNAYSKLPAVPSASENAAEGVYKHEIEFNEAKGQLIDKTSPSTSVSEWPKVSFGTATTHDLGENLAKTFETNEKGEKGAEVPIFQYYKYAPTGSTSSATKGLQTLELIKGTELNSTEASEVAAVTVTFTALPSSHNKEFNRGISLSSQMTFAYTSPSSESTISDQPCE